MKTETWIKLTDRRPTAEDFPVMLGCDKNGWNEAFCRTEALWYVTQSGWTHWFPLSNVPERPREKTQGEIDNEDASRFARINEHRAGTSNFENIKASILVGINHERSAIRAIIERDDLCELTKLGMISSRVK